jgi:muramidase (phage lysozyme)
VPVSNLPPDTGPTTEPESFQVTPQNLSQPISQTSSPRPPHRSPILGGILLTLLLGFLWLIFPKNWRLDPPPVSDVGEIAPLAMADGDPYVRALMRTISVAESNDPSPYTLLYGGQQFDDLSQHPDRCLPIVAGPNVGQCTTAAGRYQFITTTWEEKAEQYHPHPDGMFFWRNYSFEAEYQDRVVYRWLTDTDAWGTDIPELLRQGKLPRVLDLLSGTWTSLGYGIEDNQNTPYLAAIYQELLAQEKFGQ